MSMIADMEEILEEQGKVGLNHLMHYYALDLEIHRARKKADVYSKVHGTNSGSATEPYKEFQGILQGDDLVQHSQHYLGNFETGYLYSLEAEIKTGDTIVVVRKDKRKVRFKVEKYEAIGLTQEVFGRWVLSSLAD